MGPTNSPSWLSRMIADEPGRIDLTLSNHWTAVERALSRFLGYFAMLFALCASVYLISR